MCCIEESTCDIVGNFPRPLQLQSLGVPIVIRRPWNCAALAPSLRACAQYDLKLLEPDIDIGESANQAFSSGNTGPKRRVARMTTPAKLMRFFDLSYEVFPKRI